MPFNVDKSFGRVFAVFFVLLVGAMGTKGLLADTYRLETVAYTQRENFSGGDDYGDYIINISDTLGATPTCGGVPDSVGTCFETHYIGKATPVYSVTPPLLPVDPRPIPGSQSCAVSAGFVVLREFCVNGHLLFNALYTPPGGGPSIRGIFSGTDPTLDFLGFDSIDGGFMTANGNAFFIDGFDNTLVAAIDLDTIPVPEPATLILVGTGLLTGTVRRRL